MTESDPAKPPPLTYTNDLASTAGSLAIVVSNFPVNYTCFVGLTICCPENLLARRTFLRQSWQRIVWGVQLEQDLNKCVNSNIDLLQRLDNQNLVIASLRKKLMHTNAKMLLSAVRISMPYCI
jgi:hypothetical protein